MTSSPSTSTSTSTSPQSFFRPSCSTSPSLKCLCLILCLILIPQHAHASAPRRTPQKRHYDTDEYYVIEIRPPAFDIDREELVAPLGVKFVEQVGELKDSLLVRASKTFVYQGYNPEDSPPGLLQPRAVIEGEVRDGVLERFALLKRSLTDAPVANYLNHLDNLDRRRRFARSLPAPLLSSRQVAEMIRSVDRQVLRKRHKRDVIYIPSPDGSHPVLRRELPSPDYAALKRSMQGRAPASKDTLSAQLANQFDIKDPLWPKQWHLANNEIREHMINATDVWASGITGKNVTIAIVDDGLDMTSDDLKANFVSLVSICLRLPPLIKLAFSF